MQRQHFNEPKKSANYHTLDISRFSALLIQSFLKHPPAIFTAGTIPGREYWERETKVQVLKEFPFHHFPELTLPGVMICYKCRPSFFVSRIFIFLPDLYFTWPDIFILSYYSTFSYLVRNGEIKNKHNFS